VISFEISGVGCEEIIASPGLKYVLRRTTEPGDANVGAPVTRLTNGFSKKVERHAIQSPYTMPTHNSVKIHQTLKVTRAMTASVTDWILEIEEIVALLK
jgi:hypothetical protein